jgi:outer membrane protein assembly factor BamE (lipoprotein component of BamABCDE complex)
MTITIPSEATKTFEKLLGAMGGEDYSYYLFDVKNVNENPKAKKVMEVVVYVPQSKRITAAANIQGSLDGDNVIANIREKETELDKHLTQFLSHEYLL